MRAKESRHAYQRLPNSGQPPEWPKYVLLYHAVEMVLKAYLLRQGISEKILGSKEFGHDLKKLLNEAVTRGLTLPHDTQERLAALGGSLPTWQAARSQLIYGYAIRAASQCTRLGSSSLT